jgi:hypothetical protein
VATAVNIMTAVCTHRVTNMCVRDRMSANIYTALLSADDVPCVLQSFVVNVCVLVQELLSVTLKGNSRISSNVTFSLSRLDLKELG